MQVQLHSNPSVTLAEMQSAAKAEMHVLDDEFLIRELGYLGSTRQTFDLKAAEAATYRAGGYPMPLDEDTYPFLALHVSACGCTPAEAADSILDDKDLYDRIVLIAERTRLTAYQEIGTTGYLETCAQKQFNWRQTFSLSSTMGATTNKTVVTPAPNPAYDTVEVAGDGVDTLEITLPDKSLGADLEVIVESYAPSGDPWRGAYSATYTNPASPLVLTFTDPTDPAYASSDIKWLVTIRNLPRVSQQFVVDSTTA